MYHSSDDLRTGRPLFLHLCLVGTLASVMLCASWDRSSAESKPAGICFHTLTPTRAETPPVAPPGHGATLAAAVPVAAATPTGTAPPTAMATPTRQPLWTDTCAERIGSSPVFARIWPSWKSRFPSTGSALTVLFLLLAIILLAAGVIILGGAIRILNRLKREWPITKFPPGRTAALPSPPPVPPEAKKEPEVAPPPPLMTVQRPGPGIPYLESRERPKGVVYCPLTQPVTTIGRHSDNDLMIDEHFIGWPTVSRRHAQVERDGELLVLVDLDSENGVYVNGQRSRENLLHDGCVVSFGRVRFALRMNKGGSTP